jgi:Xaa-Pro aminopeptidase
MPDSIHSSRVKRCALAMKEAKIDVLLLTKPANMYFLTGDGRLCAYAMVTADGKVALGVPKTDVEDVKALAAFDEVAGFEDEVGMIHSIAHYFKHFGIDKGVMGMEHTFLTQSMMGMITHPHAKPKEVTTADCTHIISELRIVKEPSEIDRIRNSARAAAAGMAAAVKAVKPGMTESMIAAEAERAMRYAGAEEFYRTYVASGPRTSIAHGLPTGRKLEPGDLVMIDLAPIVNGYSSDMCRTVSVGKPSAEKRAAYDLYLKAQSATIAKVKAGADMMDLEKTLHGILEEAGHAGHVFGPPIHGVGIEFEEAPLPAGHAFFHGEKAPPPLRAGMVIAVGNCGLYTGPWGVRVEDTVAVGETGPEVVTEFPRSIETAAFA